MPLIDDRTAAEDEAPAPEEKRPRRPRRQRATKEKRQRLPRRLAEIMREVGTRMAHRAYAEYALEMAAKHAGCEAAPPPYLIDSVSEWLRGEPKE